MRVKVVYSPENLEAFAQQMLLTNDPERAYREVFKTKGKAKNAREGAVLVGDERVRAFMEALKMRQASAALGAAVASTRAEGLRERGQQMELGAKEPEKRVFDPWAEMPRMLERVAELAENGESESVRLKAAEDFDKLLARHQAHEQGGEEVPDRLVAFIEEIELQRSTVA